MKNRKIIGLLIVGMAMAGSGSRAQNTPVGAATSTTYPVGAVVEDSLPVPNASRRHERATKRMNRRRNGRGTNAAASQDARYRQASASDGTTINNSNATNYNSNNVTNAPTGVGSPTSGTVSNPNSSTSTRPPRR